MILYSAKSTIDAEGQAAYRITKFNDGEVESSYLTNGSQCDCPAGVRPTCRHRQMLPQMIADGIINTHWFLDWDGGKAIVDFEGTMKSALDYLLAPPAGEALQGDLPLEPLRFNKDYSNSIGHSPAYDSTTPAPPSPATWRRF